MLHPHRYRRALGGALALSLGLVPACAPEPTVLPAAPPAAGGVAAPPAQPGAAVPIDTPDPAPVAATQPVEALDMEVELPQEGVNELKGGMSTQAVTLIPGYSWDRLVLSVNGVVLPATNYVITGTRLAANGRVVVTYHLTGLTLPASTYFTVATPSGAVVLRSYVPNVYLGAPVAVSVRTTAVALLVERFAAEGQVVAVSALDPRAINLLEARLVQAYALGYRNVLSHALIVEALRASWLAYPDRLDPNRWLPVGIVYSSGGGGGGGGGITPPASLAITVSGTLKRKNDDGPGANQPVSGVRVSVDGATESEFATSGADGSFSVKVAAPVKLDDNYHLLVGASDISASCVVDVSGTGTVDVGEILLDPPGSPTFKADTGHGVFASDVSVIIQPATWYLTNFPLPIGWSYYGFAGYWGYWWGSYRDVVMPLAADQITADANATDGTPGTKATGLKEGDIVPLYRWEPWWYGGGTWRQVNPGLVVKANAAAPAHTWANKVSTAGSWAGAGVPNGRLVVVARIWSHGYYGMLRPTAVATDAGSGLVVQF